MRQVEIPNGYFLKMARHDYSNYWEALPREFYQNSIDAGATRIDVRSDEGRRMIEIQDNGCGMDEDTLQNKLLVLGGSKKAEGSVGAFGKAKELLFFSWERYEIETLDWVVKGAGAGYQIRKNGRRVNGTIARIFIQGDEAFESVVRQFSWIARKMETKAKIYVHGEQKGCELWKGTLKKEMDWCAIYQTKCRDNSYMPVRIQGIWMFDLYVGCGHGELVLELKRGSLDALTSNRDSLKCDWRRKAEQLVEDLLINKASALRDGSQDVYEKIRGTGKVKVTDERADAIAHIVSQQSGREMSYATLAEMLEETGVVAAKERAYTMIHRADGIDLFDLEYQDRLKFIGYEPDFVVKYDSAPSRVKRFMESTRARVLAKIWTETMKQVLLDNGLYLEFTAGFTFKGDANAEFVMRGDNLYFLLNPTNCGGLGKRWILIEELKDRAIHEAAHHKEPDHDERFIVQMAKIRRKMRETRSEYSRISRIQ